LRSAGRVFIVFLGLVIISYILVFFYIRGSADACYEQGTRIERRIDALVVFFGGFRDGSPNDESIRRFRLALQLYRAGRGERIIFVGGFRPSYKYSGSEMLARRAVDQGLPPSRIFFDVRSRDTIQNWMEAERIIARKGLKRVVLISSIFHLVRIGQVIRFRDDIEHFEVCYDEADAVPPKTIVASFCDYTYNMISYALYCLLPSEWYSIVVKSLRQ
jgi:uncharacterized SAM-binding protein YcdF (DUF218 family)